MHINTSTTTCSCANCRKLELQVANLEGQIEILKELLNKKDTTRITYPTTAPQYPWCYDGGTTVTNLYDTGITTVNDIVLRTGTTSK